jgi:hypothetical protein
MPSELSYSRHQQMHASLVPVAAQHAFVHDVCVLCHGPCSGRCTAWRRCQDNGDCTFLHIIPVKKV